jgi:hypothetical protein
METQDVKIMVLCIIALVVFSIMGIWSAKYRRLAKDAFKCTFKLITFRPCDVKFDEKIKMAVTSKLMINPTLARIFYKNFKIFSWIFVIAFFISLGYSIYGVYNILVYGSCDPTAPGTCAVRSGWDIVYGLLCAYESLIVYSIIIVAAIFICFFAFKHSKNKNNSYTKEVS